MSFTDWKKRSTLFKEIKECIGPVYALNDVCQAAYKAGERDGRKRVEEIARNAIELRELLKEKNDSWKKPA